MTRANQFTVRPRSVTEREVFVQWLDASGTVTGSLWNETNYARRHINTSLKIKTSGTPTQVVSKATPKPFSAVE
ncbi:hypothetical protein [Haloquadratum walsbyi]|jgi:hypothetical protein|uniref:Uncharacterized protein n=1 Tax=Haloquadratum walsbyi J07HQW2 TaxID=1238425 RepID=U1NIM7_9EURY|nr:hypothetical protein [Haloquadratum walsbyi]ERG96769.1 MAG: hypothetical protein J07HQW2_03253 [Haloquadratum walsbyi J07HQW2]ERG96773.1 MAG: hypothetical protein J07HQW2_03257 [Haloquadratum walsbyi J07HQW2]